MADLRIFSYLPNPRLFKATIVARYSGAQIEVVGDKPRHIPSWLFDYNARPLLKEDKAELTHWQRQASTGFKGVLYKTDAFLQAHPFGNVPAAFAQDGQVGLFESNSIMRAAARLGPNAPALYGSSPLQQSRIDGFLDRTLLFALEVQRYLLVDEALLPDIHKATAGHFASFMAGVEQALSTTSHLAGDDLSLADVAYVCELCLLSNENKDKLTEHQLSPVLQQLNNYPRAQEHLRQLLGTPQFAEDLDYYKARLPV